MSWLLLLAGALVGGAGNRLRGSYLFEKWTGRGATIARIVCWAVPLGMLSWVAGADYGWAILLGWAAWLGSVAGWWGSLDLGRQEGEWVNEFLLMTGRGLVWTTPMAILAGLALSNPWPLVWAGMMCSVVYEFSYRVYPKNGPELAEVLYGALIGATLIGTVSAWPFSWQLVWFWLLPFRLS